MFLLKYSYGNPKRRNILVMNILYCQFRYAFRALDLEQTRLFLGEEKWMWLMMLNTVGFTHCFDYLSKIQDENIWTQTYRFVIFTYGVLIFSSSCFGFDRLTQMGKSAVFALMVILLFVWKQKNMNEFLISYVQARIREKIQYQVILDNLEESIIILGDQNEIDFVNDKFLMQFQRYINEVK